VSMTEWIQEAQQHVVSSVDSPIKYTFDKAL